VRKRRRPRPPGAPATPAPPREARVRAGRRSQALAGTLLAVAAAAAAASWWLSGPSPAEVVRTPDQNVLLITIDTLRADALGSYGARVDTPNLDALARAGVRFDFAHAHAVVTLPSHVSILSGLYPYQHGVRENSGFRVPKGTTTAATLLKRQGYATAAFTAGFPLDSQFGLDEGFDVYDDRLDDVGQTSEFALAERPADAVVRSALEWISGRDGRWFAWVHVFDPHAPYRPPEPYRTRYAANAYGGEVAFVDAALGPLIEKARSAPRPTLVIVTGDHGEGLGDHGEQSHGVFAYEATLRIPLIVAQIGGSAPNGGRGSVSADPVQHVDILPTILDAIGSPAKAPGPGASLLKAVPYADLRASYFEALSTSLNRGWAPLRGILVGRDKYIDLPIRELYDLGRDPVEQINAAETRADRREVLHARLQGLGSTEPGARRAEDAETEARLRALGYTSGTPAPRTKAYTEADDPKRLIDLDQALHRGLELNEARRFREAEQVFRALVARRPDMTLAYLHLAFLLWEEGRPNDAIATLRAARAAVGSGTEADWRLGIYLAESGAADEALPLLERAAADENPSVDALNALGIAYARKGRSRDALATFRRIVAIDARNAMAWQNAGAVNLEARNYGAARDAFQRSIEANPRWAASYTGLGVVELQEGNRGRAIDAWTKAVELNPRDFDALFNLATELVNDGQGAAARPYLQRFVDTAPPAIYGRDIARLRGLLERPPR
jgi:arylsulfatase A-like enzyme/Tfp pilus assembly protein PilF